MVAGKHLTTEAQSLSIYIYDNNIYVGNMCACMCVCVTVGVYVVCIYVL